MLTISIMIKMGLVKPVYRQTVLYFLDSGLMWVAPDYKGWYHP